MSATRSVWAALAILYLGFTSWYTSCGGPLTRDEVDHYVSLFAERNPDADVGRLRAFLESDTGDDFVMANVIELKEPPDRIGDVRPDETASQVLDRYMAYMWPALLTRACHPVLFGQAAAPALDVWGIENADHWSTVGLMRYRSRRDMLEIASNPDFRGPHEFKVAAMAKTVAFPADPWLHLGDPRLLLALLFLVIGLSLQLALGRR